jgi:hypothetical protein
MIHDENLSPELRDALWRQIVFWMANCKTAHYIAGKEVLAFYAEKIARTGRIDASTVSLDASSVRPNLVMSGLSRHDTSRASANVSIGRSHKHFLPNLKAARIHHMPIFVDGLPEILLPYPSSFFTTYMVAFCFGNWYNMHYLFIYFLIKARQDAKRI